MGDLWSARFFFSSNLVGRIFFYSSARIFFYYICAACNFFSSDKRLQEIFFQNHPPPPPPLQELNGRTLTGSHTGFHDNSENLLSDRHIMKGFIRITCLRLKGYILSASTSCSFCFQADRKLLHDSFRFAQFIAVDIE